MKNVEQRVTALEDIMMKLAYVHIGTQASVENLSKEMKLYRETADREMKLYIEKADREMKDYREKSDREMKEYRETADREMKLYIEKADREMKEFKDEMKLYREMADQQIKEMNRKWAELAHKMGSFVEDIVAPNIPWIAKKYFHCESPDDFMIRRTKKNTKDKSKEREFDIIAVCGDRVMLNETKTTPRSGYVAEFAEFLKSGEFFDYFPEYAGKIIIPIFSSLYIPDNFVKSFTKHRIFALAMREDTMDILNPELVSKLK